MKQIIYLGGKKAREYDGVDEPKSREYYGGFPNGQSGDRDYPKAMLSYKAHISTLPVVDVIGDCDWKEGEVKTEGVDYFEHPWGINAIVTPVPIPKKQEGEEELWKAAAEMLYQKHSSAGDILYGVLKGFQKDMIFLSEHFTITRKS